MELLRHYCCLWKPFTSAQLFAVSGLGFVIQAGKCQRSKYVQHSLVWKDSAVAGTCSWKDVLFSGLAGYFWTACNHFLKNKTKQNTTPKKQHQHQRKTNKQKTHKQLKISSCCFFFPLIFYIYTRAMLPSSPSSVGIRQNTEPKTLHWFWGMRHREWAL